MESPDPDPAPPSRGSGNGGGAGAPDGGEKEEDGRGGRPLAGTVVVIDPGHNTGNRDHPAEINRPVDAGTHRKECDTTGTATNDGYSEAAFTMDVARRVRTLLRAQGATVRLTHDGDRDFGPCVDERARIGNEAHADAVVSIHADGHTAPGSRGFHVILPASVRTGKADTTAITGPSRRLGTALKRHFAQATALPPANYLGGGAAVTVRDDLGGLNLSRVPKVFIECGNMRNSADAAVLGSTSGRQLAAKGIAEGISAFLLTNS
jgi:N-acetylmuramoyl-L-alanine amidase